MNIIEAFREMERGEIIVDPEGGIWKRNSDRSDYIRRRPDGSTSYRLDVPVWLLFGEWNRKPLEDSEVLPALRRGCVLMGKDWSKSQIRMNSTDERLEYRRNPYSYWVYWEYAHIIMSYEWIIAEGPEGEAK